MSKVEKIEIVSSTGEGSIVISLKAAMWIVDQITHFVDIGDKRVDSSSAMSDRDELYSLEAEDFGVVWSTHNNLTIGNVFTYQDTFNIPMVLEFIDDIIYCYDQSRCSHIITIDDLFKIRRFYSYLPSNDVLTVFAVKKDEIDSGMELADKHIEPSVVEALALLVELRDVYPHCDLEELGRMLSDDKNYIFRRDNMPSSESLEEIKDYMLVFTENLELYIWKG